MVVKTEVCSYSGFRIYPGHGIKYVRGDSKSFLFINRKSKSYFHQKFNHRKIAWTLLYRRMHKKGTLEDTQKKTKRKVSEVEMLRALDQWGFARNPNRINVMQSGQEWVHSDTVGAIARRNGLILPQSATKKNQYMMKLVTTTI